jgi:ferredoxin-NADP reductase
VQAESRILAALADAPAAWDAGSDGVLVCRQVRIETHDVKTFVLAPRRPALFRYRPGQFVTFTFTIDGAPLQRCYTLASTPTRPHLVSITARRVPGGPVSNWLHDHFRPGMTLGAGAPAGGFTTLAHPAEKYLFLAAGSGITPLMSMARAYHDLALERDIVFVHFARSPADLIFRAELDLIARHLPHFRFVPVCEAAAAGDAWGGFAGRISLPLLRLIAPDLAAREILACGPQPFMDSARALLAEGGADLGRYHEESFTFAAEQDTPVAEAPTAPAGRTFRVEFRRSARTASCGDGTTVLAAARAAGLRPPFACTRGLCGTCKSRLLSGDVDMQHQGGIRQREIDQGMILICCARPRSDLVLDC